MNTKGIPCSERCCGLLARGWPCQKPATVVQSGKSYCTIHDPERRTKAAASKCYRRLYGRLCGQPAVEVDSVGYGLCAEHTDAALQTLARLGAHGPALLEAAKEASIYLDRGSMHTGAYDGRPMCNWWNGNQCDCLQGKLRAVIAKAKNQGGAT